MKETGSKLKEEPKISTNLEMVPIQTYAASELFIIA